MSFAIYIAGFLILIIGLAWGAFTFGLPPVWIGIGVVVLLGLGVMTGVTHTKRRDPPGE
ncbi:MAG: hypothetical protein ACREL6_13245 [Gemmatimonadales bacterium]